MIELLQANPVLVTTVVVMLGLWLLLRTRATRFAPDSSFDGMLGRGEPVVLEFFGNT